MRLFHTCAKGAITLLILLTLLPLTAYAQPYVPSSSQSAPAPAPQSQLEDQIALQIGRYQLAIAKQNSIIQDLSKQNTELMKKCGDRCTEVQKGIQPSPSQTPSSSSLSPSTKDQSRLKPEENSNATQTR